MKPIEAVGGSRFPVHAFVFVGAVLLFALEPLVGRLLLLSLGGAFHVWTTALMFFQGALFLGYLYAHGLAPRIGRAHLLVIAAALFFLPPSVGAPLAADSVLVILSRLTLYIAAPFAVLATTAIVAQRWASDAGDAEPYALYAVSNAGSLVGLFGYALLVEPFVPLTAQRWAWSIGFCMYLALGVVAWRARPSRDLASVRETWTERPTFGELAYWALLAAAPSAFLMGVTNLIALDVGQVPLVWVVPLAIYLGSFVVAFRGRVPGSVRRLWPHIALVGMFFFSGGDAGGGWIDVVVHLVVLGFVALAAHGELYDARPASHRLTTFYLVTALGGWLGGACVALAAPRFFGGLFEYPGALAVLALTIAVGRRRQLAAWLGTRPYLAIAVSLGLVIVIVMKIGWAYRAESSTVTLATERSFFGLYRVTRTQRANDAVRDLVSGTTRHGRQREGDLTPLSYYHPNGPLGDAWTVVHPRRAAVVGLGVGAAAAYVEPQGFLRFFEIDEAVVELAREHFTYLSGARGEVDVVLGDARRSLALERSEPRYELLVVDAFSGDAVPTHLLTVEAMEIDLARVSAHGVLLFHASNRYYQLRPLLAANARVLHLEGAHIAHLDRLSRDEDPSEYVALSRDADAVAALMDRGWAALDEGLPRAEPWTDERANSLEAIRGL
ncbi:MAG: spermidine synthase [Sandaracinaceae bacterium]